MASIKIRSERSERPVTVVDHRSQLAADEAERMGAQQLHTRRVSGVARIVDRSIQPCRDEGIELEALLRGLEWPRIRGHARKLGELRQHPGAQ